MDTRGICDVAKKFILKSSVFFLNSSNCQRGCYSSIFADDPDKRERESHEVQRNIRGKRCNFQTARGLISHPVEICLPIFRVIQQFLYMFGEEHPACWWTIAAGGDLCFDLCLLYIYIYIFYNHFQLFFFDQLILK